MTWQFHSQVYPTEVAIHKHILKTCIPKCIQKTHTRCSQLTMCNSKTKDKQMFINTKWINKVYIFIQWNILQQQKQTTPTCNDMNEFYNNNIEGEKSNIESIYSSKQAKLISDDRSQNNDYYKRDSD